MTTVAYSNKEDYDELITRKYWKWRSVGWERQLLSEIDKKRVRSKFQTLPFLLPTDRSLSRRQ